MLISPKRLLSGTSLRGKFLVTPVVALLAMAVLSALFMLELYEVQNGQRQLEENDLVVISGLSEISVEVSNLHSKIYDILLMAKDTGADEEQIYEFGKPVLEGLVNLEDKLVTAKEAAGEMAQGLGAWDGFIHIVDDYINYKAVATRAIEMSTVSPVTAKEHLIIADELYGHFVLDMHEGLNSISAEVEDNLGKQREVMDETLQLFILISVGTIVGIFLIGLYLSGSITGELGAMIHVITDLAQGKTTVDIPAITTGKDISALASGIAVFKDSLIKLDDQNDELEKNNALLKQQIEEREVTAGVLKDTRARFQYLLDHSPAMIYSAVPEGNGIKVTYVSENARNVLGYDAGELLCERELWNERLSMDDNVKFFHELNMLYSDGRLARDYRIKNKQGETIWVHDVMMVSRYERGIAVEMLGSLINVTDLKDAEAELRRMNDKLSQSAIILEEKVKERTADLEEANENLQRLSDSKSEFVSIVSHDLRTPLTGVKLFTDIMLDDLDNIDKETQEEYLSIISAETDRLSRLISNILDFQKISAGKMQWDDADTDIVEVIRECVRPFNVSFESKGIDFGLDCELDELMTVIDADRLAQVVYNLLSNALKFTEDGSVKVGLEKIENIDGEKFCLTVSDTGPGIPEEELQKIFEPFEQYAGVPKLGKGTGLGLYITNCVVDRYHGRAWAESVVGEGSTFHVELPVRRPEQFVI